MFGERRNLFDDAFEKRRLHQLLRAKNFRAKTALKVADVADLDVDLEEALFVWLFAHR